MNTWTNASAVISIFTCACSARDLQSVRIGLTGTRCREIARVHVESTVCLRHVFTWHWTWTAAARRIASHQRKSRTLAVDDAAPTAMRRSVPRPCAMVTVAAAPDAQQPQRDCAMSVAEDTQLQHLEALLVERLMNRSSSAAPRPCSPPQLPDSAPRHQPPHNKREKKIKKRKKRPRSDEKRMEAFRQAVAQKAKAAQDAALAIATVRPRQASPPPRAPRLSPRSPPSHVPTLRVKQLPSSLPSRRNETAATKAAAERVFVNAVEFVNSHRTEVGDFGSEALHRSDRRKYQMAKLIKLGCRPPKNQKMPIGLLQKRRKREKLTALKQKQRDLETGMLLRIKRKTKRK